METSLRILDDAELWVEVLEEIILENQKSTDPLMILIVQNAKIRLQWEKELITACQLLSNLKSKQIS